MSKTVVNKDWDKLKIGDLVYPYSRGMWQIIDIHWEGRTNTPLVTVKKFATYTCKPCKPILKQCDISWCHKIPDNALEYAKSNGCVIP